MNGVVGRGMRRAVEEAPVDKAKKQKQRRMIKNVVVVWILDFRVDRTLCREMLDFTCFDVLLW